MKTVFGEDILKEDWDYAKEWVQVVVFEQKRWHPHHALLRSNGEIVKYYGQDFDANDFMWLENGWIEDRCELCECAIKAGDIAMTTQERCWICMDCYALCAQKKPLSETSHGDDV